MTTTATAVRRQPPGELGERIVFTIGILLVWRVLHHVPLPGLDAGVVNDALRHATVAMPERISVMAIGLTPFISAWAFGELGRGSYSDAAIARFRRVATLALALFQAIGVTSGLEQVTAAVPEPGLAFRLGAVSSLVGGTMVALWLGETITRRGLGDGVWLLLAAQLVTSLPRWLALALEMARTGEIMSIVLLVTLGAILAMVALIVVVETAERRVPVTPESADHGARRLALRVDNVTILPATFAALLLATPMLLAVATLNTLGRVSWLIDLAQALAASQTLQLIATAVLIVPLTYVLTAIVARPSVILAGLQRNGGAIAGLGAKDSERTVDGILERLTAITAPYLLAVTMVPALWQHALGLWWPLSGVQLLVVVLASLQVLRHVRDLSGSSR